MKKTLMFVLLASFGLNSYALGPNQISVNGMTFVKGNEKSKPTSASAEYYPAGGNASTSLVLTHVFDKNSPLDVVQSLKQKKGVEIVDVERIQGDGSDLVVTFMHFDLPNLKVKNNYCRIKSNGGNRGSVVFQYVDTQRLRNQGEGATFPDFSGVAENVKQLPVNQYLTSMSERFSGSGYYGNLPWYKRPGARAGNEPAPEPRRSFFQRWQ